MPYFSVSFTAFLRDNKNNAVQLAHLRHLFCTAQCKKTCNLGIITLTTGMNCTRYHLCNYFACYSCNYSKIALKSM